MLDGIGVSFVYKCTVGEINVLFYKKNSQVISLLLLYKYISNNREIRNIIKCYEKEFSKEVGILEEYQNE